MVMLEKKELFLHEMNNSNYILLIDPAFDPANSSTCNLLISVGIDHLSYAIINAENKQVYAIFDEQECEDGALKLRERLKTDSYLALSYQEVKTAVYTPNTVAIPHELYDEHSQTLHAKYLMSTSTAQLHTQHLPHFNLTSLFALPKSIDGVLNEQWGNCKKYPHHAGLFALAENKSGHQLWLDFSVASFHVLYVNDGQLIFQQCYEIADAEELNYYILLFINQLNIPSAATAVHLSGIIHQDDEKYNCLSKYFSAIEFTPVPHPAELLDDMPSHYYSSLLALDQCAL